MTNLRVKIIFRQARKKSLYLHCYANEIKPELMLIVDDN